MIRHIVFWKLKPFAEGADRTTNAQQMRDMLMACSDCVPGILRFEVALASEELIRGLECTCDVVLLCDFESKSALDAYQQHPKHLALKPFFSSVRESRHCMDYELK